MFLQPRPLSITEPRHPIVNNEQGTPHKEEGTLNRVDLEDILKVPAVVDKILW